MLLTACGGSDSPDDPVNPVGPGSSKPIINIRQSEVNVFGGKKVLIETLQLKIGDAVVATWSDANASACTVTLTMSEGKTLKSGDTVDEGGSLVLTVTNQAGKQATGIITLNDSAIMGLEKVKDLNMQVDKSVNLLQ